MLMTPDSCPEIPHFTGQVLCFKADVAPSLEQARE